MEQPKWEEWRCRCSAISKIMSNSQSNPQLTEKQALRIVELREKLQKNGILPPGQASELAELEVKEKNKGIVMLSDTCIDYLMEEYSWKTTQKKRVDKDMIIDFIRKGKLAEQSSIDLLSFVDEVAYEKNEERVYNDFLSGEPDIYLGGSIYAANTVRDIKSIWDYPTFLCKLNKKPDNGYPWQLKGYGDITGAQELSIDNCLVNMPEIMQTDFLRKLLFKMEVATDENPEYKAAAAEMIASMTFDDIPARQRVHRYKVEPMTDHERSAVYNRVKVCREFLNNFHEQRQKLIA